MDIRQNGATSKTEAISQYLAQSGFKCSQAVFVDDDINELTPWQHWKLHVDGSAGLTSKYISGLYRIIDRSRLGPPPAPPPAENSSLSQQRIASSFSHRGDEDETDARPVDAEAPKQHDTKEEEEEIEIFPNRNLPEVQKEDCNVTVEGESICAKNHGAYFLR